MSLLHEITALNLFSRWKKISEFEVEKEDLIFRELTRIHPMGHACFILGLINTFLSWKVWIPLGRLTYGAYLFHLIVYMFYFFGLEKPYHYQDMTAVSKDSFSYTIFEYIPFCHSPFSFKTGSFQSFCASGLSA